MPFKLFYALLLAAALAACSRDKPAEVPALPKPVAKTVDTQAARMTELMQSVFADRYNAKKRMALAVIPVDGEEIHHAMSPLATTDLPDGRTILIVNGSPTDEKGEDMSAHASPGMLNVYALLLEGG